MTNEEAIKKINDYYNTGTDNTSTKDCVTTDEMIALEEFFEELKKCVEND